MQAGYGRRSHDSAFHCLAVLPVASGPRLRATRRRRAVDRGAALAGPGRRTVVGVLQLRPQKFRAVVLLGSRRRMAAATTATNAPRATRYRHAGGRPTASSGLELGENGE
jgi:hypothetical protein